MESVVSYDVNNYVYNDSIPEHPLLSVLRTNQTDPSTGKETCEFRLPISLWKIMLQKDKKGWILISQSGRANIIEYFTSPAKDIKGNGNDTNVQDRQNHRKISKTRTLTRNAPSSRPIAQSLRRPFPVTYQVFNFNKVIDFAIRKNR